MSTGGDLLIPRKGGLIGHSPSSLPTQLPTLHSPRANNPKTSTSGPPRPLSQATPGHPRAPVTRRLSSSPPPCCATGGVEPPRTASGTNLSSASGHPAPIRGTRRTRAPPTPPRPPGSHANTKHNYKNLCRQRRHPTSRATNPQPRAEDCHQQSDTPVRITAHGPLAPRVPAPKCF